MYAWEAKSLHPGDKVECQFSNSLHIATVIKREWPKFTVRAILTDGRLIKESRRYQSFKPVGYRSTGETIGNSTKAVMKK